MNVSMYIHQYACMCNTKSFPDIVRGPPYHISFPVSFLSCLYQYTIAATAIISQKSICFQSVSFLVAGDVYEAAWKCLVAERTTSWLAGKSFSLDGIYTFDVICYKWLQFVDEQKKPQSKSQTKLTFSQQQYL